jgi:hypothetical protein
MGERRTVFFEGQIAERRLPLRIESVAGISAARLRALWGRGLTREQVRVILGDRGSARQTNGRES